MYIVYIILYIIEIYNIICIFRYALFHRPAFCHLVRIYIYIYIRVVVHNLLYNNNNNIILH